MSWTTSQQDVEAPEILDSLRNFKVSANISEAARSRLSQNFKSLCLFLVSATWVSGLVSVLTQKVLCTSL